MCLNAVSLNVLARINAVSLNVLNVPECVETLRRILSVCSVVEYSHTSPF